MWHMKFAQTFSAPGQKIYFATKRDYSIPIGKKCNYFLNIFGALQLMINTIIRYLGYTEQTIHIYFDFLELELNYDMTIIKKGSIHYICKRWNIKIKNVTDL